MSKKAKKVLVIGWDAADWKVINPLLDAGKMPALEKLINRGVMGNIATLEPVLSPMLWTSIATGKYADKHGILGFTEPDPATGGVRAVSGTSRKVKAIWNILTQQGMKTNLIGWWPSHPAEPINGICVSNHYQRASKPVDEPWPMLKGTVYPEELKETFEILRIHPGELTEAHVKPFIPLLEKIDQEKDKRLEMFLKILADTATIQSAATWTMENTEWDFMGVYFDGIDHFSHGFMKYHPPKLAPVPDQDFEIYKDVINGGYIFHDMMLERLIQQAGEDTNIILISDHGFHSDHLRPLALPKEPAAPAYEHRPYGILCMAGPNIKKDELIYGASLLDVTPTILTMYGLPVGEDMDGKVLAQAFESPEEIKKISSWEDVEGESGMHAEEIIEDPIAAKEALDQLVELGYIDKPSDDVEKARARAVNEAKFNLARCYIGSERYEQAIEILNELQGIAPEESRYGIRLLLCYKNLGEFEKAREQAQLVRELYIKESDKLYEQRKEKEPDKEIDKPSYTYPSLDLQEGTILLEENKPKKALELFKKVKVATPSAPNLFLYLGRSFILLKQWKEAEDAFRNSLQIDGDKASAHHGLAISLLRQKRYEEAVESSLEAVGLSFNFPVAHYHLGEALYEMGEYESAAEAFEVCLKLNPTVAKARNFLIDIYENHLKDRKLDQAMYKDVDISELHTQTTTERADEQKELLKSESFGTITVVSGLPRSGTSMMMQMLERGGIDIFTDKKREADDDNPKGYYEHEVVKTSMRNRKWVDQVGDKAVKVISHLLLHLPPRYQYKVIFMDRDLNEVMRSQHKMLVNNNKAEEGVYKTGVEAAFKKNLQKIEAWVENNHNVEILHVNYTEAVQNPEKVAGIVNEFLGSKLNLENMVSAVDKSLYRNRMQEK